MPRAETVWFDTLHDNTVGGASGRLNLTLLTALSTIGQRSAQFTLLRTIICHDYSYAIHDSGEGSQILDVGIQVVNQEAFNANVVPDPDDDEEHPIKGWVYRCRHKLHGFAADQPEVDVRSVYRDIRSKRRIDNGELIISFVNSADSGAVSSVQIVGITRCLLRLG